MTFYDVRRIDYEILTLRTRNNAPYKDSGNAYPLGDRKYSNRHFRAEDDGTFSIWYADRETVDNNYGKNNDKLGRFSGPHGEYYARQKLGVVRPDNSFEFVNDIGQGDSTLLSQVLGAYVHHVKDKGGSLYEKGGLTHPLFLGFRVNCTTGQAMTEYEMFQRRVKRKRANEVMAQYSEFFTVFETMIRSMDMKGISDVFEDLFKIEAQCDKEKWRRLDVSDVKRLVDEKKYIDAGCLFAMLDNAYSHLRWRTEWHMDHNTMSHDRYIPPEGFKYTVAKLVKEKFRKKILVEHGDDVFDLVRVMPEDGIPSSQWGLVVTANGFPVKRI